jgi:hypothetical protein
LTFWPVVVILDSLAFLCLFHPCLVSQRRKILEVLAQSQDDIDHYVTTPGYRKQRPRYRLPVIPIWFDIISGTVFLTSWFAVMIGFLCTLPFLPHHQSVFTLPCQRASGKLLLGVSHGITYLEGISTSIPATWDQCASALECFLWIACAVHDLYRIHVQYAHPLPPYNGTLTMTRSNLRHSEKSLKSHVRWISRSANLLNPFPFVLDLFLSLNTRSNYGTSQCQHL